MKKLICFLFLPLFGYAQEYVAEAPLSKVRDNSFYSITLPPNITAALESDLRNIRILDNLNAEVPYMVLTETQDYSTVEWTPMKIGKQLKRGCCTIVTLFNEKKEYIDNFLLQVKNAEIHKFGALRGSDDGQLWYAVMERFQLSFELLKSEEVSHIFDFPLSNYKYYQLTISDSTTTPLNVVGALRTREDVIHGGYIEIPNVTIASSDSTQNRETWGIIRFDTTQYVDRIEFDVFGPHLFKRNATLFVRRNNHLQPVQSFNITSGQSRPLLVGLKEKELFIRVNNDNNPPLKFTQVAAYQLKRSLITYLEAGHDYRIALGNDLRAPDYDLGFFRDSIPVHLNELEIGTLKETPVLKAAEPQGTIFTDRKFIWIAIILVGIVLATMTVRMLKDKDFKS
jgi:hypothetical protein